MRKAVPVTLVVVLLLAGCGSTPPDRVAYNALSITAKAVDTAMSVSGDLYRAGKITEAQKAQILDAYAKYQKAMTAAVLTLSAITTTQQADKLASDIAAIAQNVLNLVASFKKGP